MDYLTKFDYNVAGEGVDPITQGKFSYKGVYIPIYSDNSTHINRWRIICFQND